MKTALQSRFDQLTIREQQIAMEFVSRVCQQLDDQILSIVLFGSRARGDAEPDSDMDILVVTSNADLDVRNAIRDLAVEVWLEHGIYISTRVWSQAHWRQLEEMQTFLYRNICRDGIDLLAIAPASL